MPGGVSCGAKGASDGRRHPLPGVPPSYSMGGTVQMVRRVSQRFVGPSSTGRAAAPVPVTNDSTESDSRLSLHFTGVNLPRAGEGWAAPA
jgi:hypothetical protein